SAEQDELCRITAPVDEMRKQKLCGRRRTAFISRRSCRYQNVAALIAPQPKPYDRKALRLTTANPQYALERKCQTRKCLMKKFRHLTIAGHSQGGRQTR